MLKLIFRKEKYNQESLIEDFDKELKCLTELARANGFNIKMVTLL